MAKNEKVRTEDFSLDDELNFDQFDYEKIDSQLTPDAKKRSSRSPTTEVFKGTISGAVDKFKSPSFLARLTRSALPEEFGTIVDAADKAAGTASSLYDDAVKELKPQASRLAKKVDRLVPEERKTLKKISSRIASLFGDESSPSSLSKEQLQDQGIATNLGSIFQQQQATQTEVEARRNAKDEIVENIRRKEFDQSLGILTTISNNVGRMSSYQERITQAVQKKSLELQYRSYFALTDIASTSKQYFEVFKAQNEAIAKNTALPEFVKIKASERFKDLARTKFMDRIQNSFFGEGSAIDRGLKRITADIKDYVKGVKQGLEAVTMGVDSYQQLKETNDILKEIGGEQLSGAQLAGNAFGGFLGDKVGDKVGRFARPRLDKVPALRNALTKGANAVTNLPGAIGELRKSDKAQEYLKAEGPKGSLARGIDRFANYFTDSQPDNRVNSPYGITSPSNVGVFNDKTQRSITDIIPGYLARILREITVLRTGDEQAEMVYYDQSSGKFVNRKAIGEMVKKSLSDKIKTSSYGFFARDAAEDFIGDKKTDEGTKAKITDFIAKVSSIPNMAFTPENIKTTNAYKMLDPDTKKLVDTLLDHKVTNAEDPLRGQLGLTKSIMNVRSATPDARGVIEQLIHAGYGELLEEQGLVDRDAKGDFIINEEAYLKLVRDEGLVTSDRNKKTAIKKARPKRRNATGKRLPKQLIKSDEETKEDIHPLHPKRALNAIRKTGIFDWFYKPGEGDDEQHRGPMAQDVRKNMGDGAAPGGKKIDLTSMNGNNMAAIQELADQQDDIVDKVKKLFTKKEEAANPVKAIATDVKAIRKLVESGKGGFGGGAGGRAGARRTGSKYKGEDTYQDILGNIWTASGELVKRGAQDAKAGAIRGYEYGRDRIVKPGMDKAQELYDRYRDPFLDKLRQARDKGGELAQQGYAYGKDYIDNKLPIHIQKAKDLLTDAKATVKNSLYAVRDVYIKGRKSPVIKASLLREGEYYDSASGQVLKTMDDLVKAKGAIVNKAGEVILDAQDLVEGVYDQYGNRVKTGLERIAEKAKDLGGKTIKALRSTWDMLLQKGQEFGGKLMDKWLPGIKDFFQNFGLLGNKRIYDVLVEMRDLMRGENPPRHEEKYKKSGASGATFTDLKSKAGELKDKITAKGMSLKDKAMELLDKKRNPSGKKTLVGRKLAAQRAAEKDQSKSLKDKLLETLEKRKNPYGKKTLVGRKLAAQRAAGGGDEEITTTTEGGSEGTELETPEAKYTSDKTLGDTFSGILGGAKSLKDRIMNRFAKEEEVAPEPVKGKRRRRKAKAAPVEPPKTGFDKLVQQGKDKLASLGGTKGLKERGSKVLGSIKANAGGLKGKLLGGAMSFFGGKAEEAEPETKKRGRKKTDKALAQKAAPKKTTTTRRRRKVDNPAYNDRDGSGRRDGSWEDRLEAQAEADAQRRANAPGLQAAEAKYVSEKDIFKSIMDKVSGVFSFLTSGAGRLFGAAGSVISGVGSVASMAGGLVGKVFNGAKGLLGLGGRAAGAVGSALGAIGRPIAGAVAGAGRVGMVANLVSKVGMIRNVALVGSLMTGGVGSAILGAVGAGISAIGAVLASPVVLGAAAVAAVGYGAYKLYKYSTRDNVNDTEQIRMYQYGLTVGDKSHNHLMLALEEYLLDGRVGFVGDKAVLMDKKIDPEELLNIFSIDKADGESASKLGQWFDARFKPFFLTNCTALYAVNKKVSLKNAHDELTAAEKVKFYGLIGYESGPYNVTVSPFKDLPQLAYTRPQVQELIKVCTATAKEAADKQAASDKDKAEKKAKADKDKADKAAKAVAGVTAVTAAIDPTKKPAVDPKADEGKKVVAQVVKSNEDRNKAAPRDESQSAEDGPLREKPATGEKGPVDKTINEGPSKLGGPLKVADGPVRDGSQAMQYLKMGDGVKLDGMNPAMKQQLLAMIQEYGERTGKSVTMNAAVRDTAEQEKLFRQNPKKAARPGTSLHEYGLAVDMNSGDLDAMDDLGLMRKYGFTRPVGGEPWHTEAAGIQGNLKLAKNDPNFASQAVGASINKGGGGVGSIRGTPLGKRDTMFAVAQMGLTGQTVKDDGKSDKDKVAELAQGPNVSGANEPVTAPKPVAAVAAIKPPMQTAANAPSVGVKQASSVQASYQQSDKYNAAAKMPDMEARPKDVATAGDDKQSGPYGDVKDKVTKVARQEGVPPNDLLTYAAVESSLNPNARSTVGTSEGLFGFTNASWNQQVQVAGPRMGPNPRRTDVEDSTIAASDYYKTNKRFISSVKPNPNMTDVYLAHFLGPTGARKFLSADPNEIAANVLPNAAAANRSYFYEGTRPLTVGEVYRKIDQRLSKKAQEFGINYQGGGDLQSKPAARRMSDEPPVIVRDATGGQPPVTPRASTEPAPIVRQPMPMAQGRVAPVVPTTAVQPDTVSRPQAMGSSSQTTATTNDILTKSLDIHVQTLSVLQKMLQNSEAMTQAVTKAAAQPAQAQQPNAVKPVQQPASFQRIEAAVDLTRKSA